MNSYVEETIQPKTVSNFGFHLVGAGLMGLNCLRHRIKGYTTPRTFPISEIERGVAYDLSVVDGWINHLTSYRSEQTVEGGDVLELGPGADLGTGLILLAMGAKSYTALDVNALVNNVPMAFYDSLFQSIGERWPQTDVSDLKDQLTKCLEGRPDRLRYHVDKSFDVSSLRDKVDLVFSQAAFEHFVAPDQAIQQLSQVVRTGGVLVTEIDLCTHTRWIKDQDPLNIYRYSDGFWNLCRFNGSPNRVRGWQYKSYLETNGWNTIEIRPLRVLDAQYVRRVQPSLCPQFRSMQPDDIEQLSIMLLARKSQS